jgi:hypothetical protein
LNHTTLIDSVRKYSGIESRRSSRIEYPISLLISGHDEYGQEFLERTAPISLNLHGCRYPSRHDCHIGSWVVLQIGEPAVGQRIRSVRAQVRSVQLPRSARELYHIGVELEIPSNVWEIPSPPEDWQHILTGETTLSTAVPAATTDQPRSIDMSLPGRAAEKQPEPAFESRSESRNAEATTAPSAKAAPVLEMRPAESTAPPNRVVVNRDQLIAALQGRLQQSAETAVKSALAQHLAPALAKALTSIEEARQSAVQKVSDASSQQRSALVHTSREELLARLEDRLDEVRPRWDSQMEGFRIRAEEIVQSIDRQAAQARQDLAHTKEIAEKAMREMEPRLAAQLAEALTQATEDFDRNAAQMTERQMTRMAETAQSAIRETLAHLQANVAEARATVNTAAREALDEFQRQADVHAGLAMEDTTQNIRTALAALEAQHHAACDARRQSLEEDVRRAGEQHTEQFRQSLRAFFYSCLVAAVGAVEQHSKATAEGLSLENKQFKPPDF